MNARLVFLLAAVPTSALADRFDDWDKNEDGVLQRDELPAGARQNFEQVDKDGDGVISRVEHLAFTNRRPGDDRRPGGVANADGIKVLKDLDYVGEGNPRQTLDLFLPSAVSKEPRPLLVFIHGGGWRKGSKEGGLRRLAPLLKGGKYVGASINYRLSSEAQWPSQIHDCKAAIRWLKGNAGKYGFDPTRIAVWGTSAGGHLVAMLGVAGDVPDLEGKLGKHLDQDSTVKCVVNYFGPANMLTMGDHPSTMDHNAADSPEGLLLGGAIGDKRELARNASPVTHVSKADAPTLIAHGTKDPLVPHAQSVEFSALLEKAGVPVTFITLEGAGHGFRSAELDKRVAAFLEWRLLEGETNVSAEPIPPGK